MRVEKTVNTQSDALAILGRDHALAMGTCRVHDVHDTRGVRKSRLQDLIVSFWSLLHSADLDKSVAALYLRPLHTLCKSTVYIE